MPLFETIKKNAMGDDTKYSRAIKTPQYEPADEKPAIESLVDSTKYRNLIRRIKDSGVSEDEKLFLILAASRHIVFNYARIADYYAHASAEMQDLMEQSALVILDVDDAVKNGYIVMSAKMEQLIAEAKARKDGGT